MNYLFRLLLTLSCFAATIALRFSDKSTTLSDQASDSSRIDSQDTTFFLPNKTSRASVSKSASQSDETAVPSTFTTAEPTTEQSPLSESAFNDSMVINLSTLNYSLPSVNPDDGGNNTVTTTLGYPTSVEPELNGESSGFAVLTIVVLLIVMINVIGCTYLCLRSRHGTPPRPGSPEKKQAFASDPVNTGNSFELAQKFPNSCAPN